jgi:Mrp family chromosome partitioning ATPase
VNDSIADMATAGRSVPDVMHNRLPPRLAAGSRLHGLEPGELVKLHHSLAESLESAHGVIAQFVAPEPDAAIEAVVYDLAYVSAAWLDKRVLFVNGTGMRFDMKDHASSHRQEPVLASELDVGDIESAITRVVGLELYQMTFPSMRGALGMAPALRRMPMFLDRLRDTFDLVVIASPPASEAPMGILLSRFVDGNILVLEAGRTRAPVAAELRNSLSASGGAVVGAVLTRYRSPIPRFLRRWL